MKKPLERLKTPGGGFKPPDMKQLFLQAKIKFNHFAGYSAKSVVSFLFKSRTKRVEVGGRVKLNDEHN